MVDRKNDILFGSPVSSIPIDNFLRVEGKSFAQQVAEFFFIQGGKASSSFGEVLLDISGVHTDKAHGIGRLKATSFASVKDVLEKGVVILPMTNHYIHGKSQKTGMIAAPITIDGVSYICVVVVIDNNKTKKLYVHEVSIYKNLLDAVLSNWDTNVRPSHQGEIVRCLIYVLITKKNMYKKYTVQIYKKISFSPTWRHKYEFQICFLSFCAYICF